MNSLIIFVDANAFSSIYYIWLIHALPDFQLLGLSLVRKRRVLLVISDRLPDRNKWASIADSLKDFSGSMRRHFSSVFGCGVIIFDWGGILFCGWVWIHLSEFEFTFEGIIYYFGPFQAWCYLLYLSYIQCGGDINFEWVFYWFKTCSAFALVFVVGVFHVPGMDYHLFHIKIIMAGFRDIIQW